MLRFAVYFGVSEYLFIQCGAVLSEFPEKLSAMYWARRRKRRRWPE